MEGRGFKVNLTLLSLNAHKFLSPFRLRRTLSALKKLLDQYNVDLVFLQELQYSNHTQDLNNDPLEILADQTWPYFAYGKNAIYSGGHHGNAILSKYPIKSSENIDISNHVLESRGLLMGTIDLPKVGNVVLACTHLDLSEVGRRKQYKKILNSLSFAIETQTPTILAGDLNDWKNKSDHFLGPHGFVSVELSPSYPSFFPLLKLDKVFLHKAAAQSAKTLDSKEWRKISDHLPIYVEIKFS